jgi:hypothetical protein
LHGSAPLAFLPRAPTLNLDDDALKLVPSFRGRLANGFVVFDIAPGGPKITTRLVRELESKLENDGFSDSA